MEIRSNMAEKLRSLLLVSMILLAGGYLGSTIGQWTSEEGSSSPIVSIANLPDPGLGRIRVEVLNAGGVSGMASLATDHLRELGFDVVSFGNASRFDQENTIVIDRSDRGELAEAVADALGVELVRDSVDLDPFLDVTVVLGKVWGIESNEKDNSLDLKGLPWWNIRKYLR